MDITTVLSVSTFIMVLICILMATFLLTVKSSHNLGNRILACFLIILAITISVFCYGFYIEIPLAVDKLRDDIGILLSPLLYFYVLASIYTGFKFKKIHLVHLLPFVIVFIVLLPRFYMVDEEARRVFLGNYYEQPEAILINALSRFVPLFYISLVYWTLAKAKKVFLENYTDARLILHKWLFQLNTISLFLFCFGIFKNLYRSYAPNENAMHIARIATVFLLISFLCWIVMKALYHPDIFRGIDAKLKSINIAPADTKVKKKINDRDRQRIEALLAYMENHRPYLNSSLTLQSLSTQVGIVSSELSILINHKIGKHFFDFINEHRIQEAQKILADSSQNHLNISEILYQVGFNSKSSFNTAFKKYAKMTPTQYRKNSSLSTI